ncbi:riboflavin synthase, partial [bacterium]|nr:riboflavin synthase [bacterium]
FSVAVIPLTLLDTTLQYRHAGDKINLEYDIIGKYVDRWLQTR